MGPIDFMGLGPIKSSDCKYYIDSSSVTWSPNFSSTRANKEEENFQQDRMKGGEGGGAGCSFFFFRII